MAYFSDHKITRRNHHTSHASHHTFTIKTPQPKQALPQNTPIKRPQSATFPIAATPEFFPTNLPPN
jgi:hypothetical protein